MVSKFRIGNVRACSAFLAAVPRSAMIEALVEHCSADYLEGDIKTTHQHDTHLFHITTHADRQSTSIRLE